MEPSWPFSFWSMTDFCKDSKSSPLVSTPGSSERSSQLQRSPAEWLRPLLQSHYGSTSPSPPSASLSPSNGFQLTGLVTFWMNISAHKSIFWGEPKFRNFHCFPTDLKKENYLLPMVSSPPVTRLLPTSPDSSFPYILLTRYDPAILNYLCWTTCVKYWNTYWKLMFSQKGHLCSLWALILAITSSSLPHTNLAIIYHPFKAEP